MQYRTKAQALAAYNAGHFEELYKDVNRYGTITADVQWEDERGAWRTMQIIWYGVVWEYTRRNGEIIEAGYYPEGSK